VKGTAAGGTVPAPPPFAHVYEQFFTGIHGYVAGRLGRDLADDIAADTFVIALRKHDSFDGGRSGVGVRSGVRKGSVYTIIFSRRTYAPLGMNWTAVAGPMKGTHNGEVVLKTAIVNRAGQLP
jgi:hypothetical protein